MQVNDILEQETLEKIKNNSKLIGFVVTYETGQNFILYAISPKNLTDEEIIEDMYSQDWGDFGYQCVGGPHYSDLEYTVTVTEIDLNSITEDTFKYDFQPYYVGEFMDYYNWIDFSLSAYMTLKRSENL